MTGISKKTQVFRCKHYNISFHCEAFVKFYFNYEKKIFILVTMNNAHSHIIGQVVLERNMYTLTKEQKSKIEECTKIIFCAIHIGRNLKANVGVEMLYYFDKMRNGLITE